MGTYTRCSLRKISITFLLIVTVFVYFVTPVARINSAILLPTSYASSTETYSLNPEKIELPVSSTTHSNNGERDTVLYVITPTYTQKQQKAWLTRLADTLRLTSNVVWIVIEDSHNVTQRVTKLLKRQPYTVVHMAAKNEKSKVKAAVARNHALHWLRLTHSTDLELLSGNVPKRFTWPKIYNNERFKTLHESTPHVFPLTNKPRVAVAPINFSGYESEFTQNSVVYFADDDNTYDSRIFEMMKSTRVMSVWPVAFVGGLMVEKPLVDNQNRQRVTGWDVQYMRTLPFRIDMSGFALNLKVLLNHPNVYFAPDAHPPESKFLTNLNISLNDITPLSLDEVLVWHTKFSKIGDGTQELKYYQRHSKTSYVGMDY